MTNWETCVQFHGHACGGLTIGYKAACYAAELLELSFSGDEQVVCIAENDACGVDAIQALLGCSIGKGNLLFHMRGKQAFSFYNRATGKSVRLVLRPRPEGMTREESFLGELHGKGEPGLAAKGGEDGVWAFFLDDALDRLQGQRLDVDVVGHGFVGHDGSRIGIDQHNLIAEFSQCLARLCSRIIELTRLSDNDWTGTDNQYFVNVISPHVFSLSLSAVFWL